ncbi:MAG: AI-2E family transporter [Chloroflexota bacterium]
MRNNRLLDLLIALLVVIAAIYLVQLLWRIGLQFAHVLLLFFVAWVVSFLLTPLVEVLHRLWLPRVIAITLVYLLLGGLITVLVLLALPGIVTEGNALAAQFPAYTVQAQSWIDWGHAELTSLGITDDYLVRWFQDALGRLQGLSTNLTLNVLSVATSVITALVNMIIVLVLSFYMMLDGHNIADRLVKITPTRGRVKLLLLFENVARSFGAFARAQFLLAFISGVLTFGVLKLFHVGYAAGAAVLAGLGMLFPFLGPLLAIIPPLLIAAFWVTSVGQFVWIFVILWVTQQLLVNILAPRLLGDVVGMHPLLVLFALFGGATVAGIWGALFGVPIAAVAFLMLRDFFHEVLEPSRYYTVDESRTMVDSAPSTPETAGVEPAGRGPTVTAGR